MDIPSGQAVTADFRHITLDMEREWTRYHRPFGDGTPPGPPPEPERVPAAHTAR